MGCMWSIGLKMLLHLLYTFPFFLLPQGIINFAVTPSSGEEDSTKSRHYLEKFAFSNAMAASVKLGALETSLDKIIDSIEFLSEDMKEGRPFATSR